MESMKYLVGQMTELIMMRVQHNIDEDKLPRLSVNQYNAVYSAVRETLVEMGR